MSRDEQDQFFSIMPEHWQWRTGTIDAALFNHIVFGNEYELPDTFTSDDVIVDIGAHMGSFSWAALTRGAGMVYAYEVQDESFQLLFNNLAPYADRTLCRNIAVWRSDKNDDVLFYDNDNLGAGNTGSGTVLRDYGEEVSATIGLDAIIDTATRTTGRIRMIKFDCEGSEFPILYTTTKLHLVDEICGEYHDWNTPWCTEEYAAFDEVGKFRMSGLAKCLRSHGFSVTSNETPGYPGIGHFRAIRSGTPLGE